MANKTERMVFDGMAYFVFYNSIGNFEKGKLAYIKTQLTLLITHFKL